MDRGDPPVEPVGMMADALRRALEDSGAGAGAPLPSPVDAVRVSQSLSRRWPEVEDMAVPTVGHRRFS